MRGTRGAAYSAAQLGECLHGLLVEGTVGESRQAKVADLDGEVVVEQQVQGLEVAVDNLRVPLVENVHALGDLQAPVDHHVPGRGGEEEGGREGDTR